MNRINQLFKKKQNNILSIYFCSGHPEINSTTNIIKSLVSNGVDMVEIGIPFSDPIADGQVIQDAATKSLKNGMSLKLLFDQLRDIREDIDIPLLLMGYLNPIMHYGFESFCKSCSEVGIDGVIIPDLPFKDYLDYYRSISEKYDIRIIMLITPETSVERIQFIDQHTDGFIYMVSSASTTGAQKEFDSQKQAYFERINQMHLKNPRMIGFGISNKQTLTSAFQNASGAIIGSKFISLLNIYNNAETAIKELFKLLEK